ncbi:hypothetical protein OSB04_010053 [Centaurea solstitialis]|uniref:Gem-associated protein 2 n=1 Tax=Centaurea solstitialis TaxID=347529 RepID=A0AA38WMR1_9ASTR|nr:hypothetical protein OSB04_010053 [Centaurea solstitialis]
MAESSSILESNPSSSDDFIIKTIQETIDSHLGLLPKPQSVDNQEPHDLNSSIPSIHQIKDLKVDQEQQLASNDETHLIKLPILPNPTTIVNDSSPIEAIDVKKEKRVRKRGKGLKKNLNLNLNSSFDFERINVCDCDKRGGRERVRYLREEMEGLRYEKMEEQKKKWVEVYCGLGDVVAKEFDGCLKGGGGCGGNEDGNYVNFDPRTLLADKKEGILGNEPNNVGGGEMQNMKQVDNVSGVNGNDLDDSVGGEEDYYEDEDSDAELFSIQRPAFVVTGEPDFDSGPPQDGLEYLRRVRWEAEHIPKVKVAKVEREVFNKEQTVYMPNIPEIAACPEHIMPSKEWEDVFLADFSELRRALSQEQSSASTISSKIELYPLAQNILESVILENLDSSQTDNDTNSVQENLDFGHTDNDPNPVQENLDFRHQNQTEDHKPANRDWPSLRAVLEIEPVARVTMLRKRITSIETASCLDRNECAWLFALCAAIDTPLDADTSASFRGLLRKCAALRAEKTGLDDEAIMLNILVTISGRYFGQAENGLV